MFFIALVSFVLIIFIILFVLNILKSIGHIDLMFLIWSLLLLVPFFLIPHYNYYNYGVFYLLAYFSIGFLGYFIIKLIDNGKVSNKENKKICKKYLTQDLIIILALLYGVIEVFSIYGLTISVQGLGVLSTQIATERYNGSLELSTVQILSFVLLYGVFGIKGYQSVTIYNWNAKYFLLTYIPVSLLYSVTYNSKATVLYCIVLFLSFRYGFYFQFNSGQSLKREVKKIIKYLPIFYILILVLFVGMGLLRYGMEYLNNSITIIEDLNIYAFGYHPGFTHWYETYIYSNQSLHIGTQTLQGFFELIGINVVDNYYILEKNIYGDRSTNVDSALKDYIMDFGSIFILISSVVLMIVITTLSRLYSGKFIEGAVASFMYANLLWFFVNPFFTYQTISLAYLLILIYIYIDSRKNLNP